MIGADTSEGAGPGTPGAGVHACPACEGTGRRGRCKQCGGTGRIIDAPDPDSTGGTRAGRALNTS